ncbi:MAG TPA: hypothetical protein VD947_00975, partial [Patescibacteria group bacterium]|nr:hypothetical protein [Patescibacteria group bacterium]
MSVENRGEITRENVGSLEIPNFLPTEETIPPPVIQGIRTFTTKLLRHAGGAIEPETFGELTRSIANYEAQFPAFSGVPFRYPIVPELETHGIERSAEATVISAVANQTYLADRFGPQAFAATDYKPRNQRLEKWYAPLGDDYALQFRGGSGAGTFSLDIGLGMIDPTKEDRPPEYNYRELWRVGIDTAHNDGVMGTRFIRTGTAISPSDST